MPERDVAREGRSPQLKKALSNMRALTSSPEA